MSITDRADILFARLRDLLPPDAAEELTLAVGELLHEALTRAVAEKQRADAAEAECRKWGSEVFPSAVATMERQQATIDATNSELTRACEMLARSQDREAGRVPASEN